MINNKIWMVKWDDSEGKSHSKEFDFGVGLCAFVEKNKIEYCDCYLHGKYMHSIGTKPVEKKAVDDAWNNDNWVDNAY